MHPFAEEMNKSRRMAALGAQALATNGWLVLQIDLTGCGDSEGEFGDINWQHWLDDVSQAWAWLQGECNGVLGIWALRAGSLLAAEWLRQNRERAPLLLWQPIRNGEQHLVQFLRLKAVNEMLAAKGGDTVNELKAKLDAGQAVEVAGYWLSPGLAQGLRSSRLELPEGFRSSVIILEVVPEGRREPSPAIAALAEKWRESDVPVRVRTTHGARFWQTLEIETAPALIEATLAEVATVAA